MAYKFRVECFQDFSGIIKEFEHFISKIVAYAEFDKLLQERRVLFLSNDFKIDPFRNIFNSKKKKKQYNF